MVVHLSTQTSRVAGGGCKMREITAKPSSPNPPPRPPCSFNSIHLYLYSFLPSPHLCLLHSILFFLTGSPFYPPPVSTSTYLSMPYHSFLLQPLLLFVYVIVVCPRRFSGNYFVPAPPPTNPLLFIRLFIYYPLVSRVSSYPRPPIITNNLNFNFTVRSCCMVLRFGVQTYYYVYYYAYYVCVSFDPNNICMFIFDFFFWLPSHDLSYAMVLFHFINVDLSYIAMM